MEYFNDLLSAIDYILDTKRKRHITGGILLSMSLLFGGLSITVFTVNEENNNV